MKLLKNKKYTGLLTGNEAIAEGALAAGCRFYAGYPITPQNELIAYMAAALPRYKGVFIQAESELAAINMVFGAAAAGARAMTSSSSPGVSLKQEGISYLSGAQLPALIVNVMRGGPGLGNIAPSQSDYFQATKGGGHGDYHTVVLAPSSVQEAFELARQSFEVAERYRIPVTLLIDAFLGQMAEAVKIARPAHTKQKNKKPWALTGARGRQPNITRSFFMREGALTVHNRALQKIYTRISREEARSEEYNTDNAGIVIVAYGISFRIAREAANTISGKSSVGIFRPVTLWPYPAQALRRACKSAKAVLVCELSAGQMVEDVERYLAGRCPVYFFGQGGGEVFTAGELRKVLKKIIAKHTP
jgi:2-oxoglutarate ferredoxin oxidoreductase subunit alpha